MIDSWQIGDALRPRLGSALAEDPALCEGAAALLRGYAPYRDTFRSLAARVEEYLFNALYERLGPSMSAQMDSGFFRRIRVSELPELADCVMGVLFDSLKVYSVSYDNLHAYCMETGSPAALRTLLTRYEAFTPPSERVIMERIFQDREGNAP